MSIKLSRWHLLPLAGAVFLIAFPFASDDLYWQNMLILSMVFAIGAVGLNIITGYAGYVSLVPETDALAVLAAQPAELKSLAGTVPAERERHRYAPGKWSVRELFGHLTDAERVFGYRAFCISRGDQASLPGATNLGSADIRGGSARITAPSSVYCAAYVISPAGDPPAVFSTLPVIKKNRQKGQ